MRNISAESTALNDVIDRIRAAGMFMIADEVETLAKAAEKHQHKSSTNGAPAAD